MQLRVYECQLRPIAQVEAWRNPGYRFLNVDRSHKGVTTGSHGSYKSHGSYTTHAIYATNASSEKHPRGGLPVLKERKKTRKLATLVIPKYYATFYDSAFGLTLSLLQHLRFLLPVPRVPPSLHPRYLSDFTAKRLQDSAQKPVGR